MCQGGFSYFHEPKKGKKETMGEEDNFVRSVIGSRKNAGESCLHYR